MCVLSNVYAIWEVFSHAFSITIVPNRNPGKVKVIKIISNLHLGLAGHQEVSRITSIQSKLLVEKQQHITANTTQEKHVIYHHSISFCNFLSMHPISLPFLLEAIEMDVSIILIISRNYAIRNFKSINKITVFRGFSSFLIIVHPMIDIKPCHSTYVTKG